LRVLAELPALEELRLRGTRITDEGFRKALADKATLRKLDVRSTAVASKTLRAWKSAGTGREYLK
jgi:hypothetical protein